MNTYHFTIVVRDAVFDDFLEDKLFNAGCDDALLCQNNEMVYLEFDREADNATFAIQSAFDDLKKAGFYDLILQEKGVSSLLELSKRAGIALHTLNSYANNQQSNNFPKPVYGILSGSLLYAWNEVADWLYKNNHLPKNDYEVAISANRLW